MTRHLLAMVLVSLAAAGCRSPRPAYPDGRSEFRWSGPASPRALAITPPEDWRRREIVLGSHNLAFVPLVAASTSVVYRPESVLARHYGRGGPAFFEPRVSLLDGLVEELSSERVFASVRPLAEGTTTTADLTLSTRLLETSARRTRISAGASVFGYALLGLVGIPNESYRTRLVVDLALTETATGRELWTTRISEEDATVKSFYYGHSYDLSGDFARLFRRGLGPALASLASYEAAQGLTAR
jgi:hypothetical protein